MSVLSRPRSAAQRWAGPWLVLLGVACESAATSPESPDHGASSGAGAPGGGTAGSGAAPGSGLADCQGAAVPVPKRLVRLSFNQIANSVRALTTDELAANIESTYEIGDSQHRTFPPLASPREGSTLTDASWAKGDKIAADVAKYVVDHAATLTACGPAPSADCARSFVLAFAERAFRRPLTPDEQRRLGDVLSQIEAIGGGAPEQLEYGIYAALESPQFLYRTELGANAGEAGPLTPDESASQLAFFLTDAPPDPQLLDAARRGELGTPAQLGAQVRRLLASPAARQNLEDAMFSYFGLYGLEKVIVDSPDFNDAVRNSMLHEAELLLKNNLWGPKLASLLSARQSSINATLAPLYGVPAPTSGLDADGFGQVDLPAARAGMLTSLGFLTARSRPDQPSVVGRGLLVNAALLCATNPEFPKALSDQIAAVGAMLADATERAKSDYRTSTPPCDGCHASFDPYGLALGNFDSLGRYRATDAQGRPIDPAVTLPPNAGGVKVASATEMADALAAGSGFSTCMAKNLMLYALAEVPADGAAVASVSVDGCATRAIADGFGTTGQSFSDLVEQVAISGALAERAAGQATK